MQFSYLGRSRDSVHTSLSITIVMFNLVTFWKLRLILVCFTTAPMFSFGSAQIVLVVIVVVFSVAAEENVIRFKFLTYKKITYKLFFLQLSKKSMLIHCSEH